MKFEVVRGDITQLDTDAIVNAANEGLTVGEGVCGAIHKAAGPELAVECQRLRRCFTGSAVLTPGYNLKARYVIHAVAPVYDLDPQGATRLLESAYQSIFRACDQNKIRTVAIPCLGTGIYGFPNEPAAAIAVQTSVINGGLMDRIVFCCFKTMDFDIYRKLLSGTVWEEGN